MLDSVDEESGDSNIPIVTSLKRTLIHLDEPSTPKETKKGQVIISSLYSCAYIF